MEKLGLKETLEVQSLLVSTLNKAAEAMKDDGKISTGEALSIAMGQVGEAMRAVAGASQIPAEIKDLDDEEKTQLAQAGLELMVACLKLFKPELADEVKASV